MSYFASIISICLLVFTTRILSKKYNILDKPNQYNDTKWRRPVPTLQGIFLYVIFIIIVALFYPDLLVSQNFWYLSIFWLPLIVIWSLDDVYFTKIHIPTRSRFVLQIAVSVGIIFSADLWIESFRIWWQTIVFWYLWGKLLSLIWFILCINAVNWFDGINGQASWVSAIWFITVYYLISFVVFPTFTDMTDEYKYNLQLVQNLSLILTMLAIVYAGIERKPWWLVRDPWTFFYWFTLAYLSLLAWAKIGTMLVVLSLVVFDALWVCTHRIFALKKAPRKGDYCHLHHRLLRLWWTKKEVNMFIWIWSIVMMILMLLQSDNRPSKIIIFVMMALLFFGINAYIFRIKKLPCGFSKQITPKKT